MTYHFHNDPVVRSANKPTAPAPDQFHFYASSAATWLTTGSERDLPELIRMMDREGFKYSLWLVPVSADEPYEIRFFAPQVEGAKYLGTFEPKSRRH